MLVSTPYTECYVKKSFLTSKPIYTKDETIFGVLMAIRFIRGRAPLYVVYFPSIGALYDKVDQCAIFNKKETPSEEIKMTDVGWWDCISDYWQLTQIKSLKGFIIHSKSKTNKKYSGQYMFTCDPQGKHETVDWGQSEVWHEHKTKTYFFDEKTGVLISSPNNKMIIKDSSLSPSILETPKWLRVYKDENSPQRTSFEDGKKFLGETDSFTYEQ